jgi:RND family efflux transporter MFP subunit
VQVPESYTQDVGTDLTADLHVTQFPQRVFTGKLASNANALDPVTRTLLVEFEVDNDKGELLPGSYAEAHINLPSTGDNVHIPVNTLLFRGEGLQVAVVDKQSKAQLKPITIGRDYGKEVEVTSGLNIGETIIVNPADSLGNGQAVRIVKPADKHDKPDAPKP